MDENKKVFSDNISPAQTKKLKKKKEKQEKSAEKTRKIVILDGFGKSIMKTFIIIAFIAVL